MNKLFKLHEKLNLHTELLIIYVVDGYQAIIYNEDLLSIQESEVCETITSALLSLESKL